MEQIFPDHRRYFLNNCLNLRTCWQRTFRYFEGFDHSVGEKNPENLQIDAFMAQGLNIRDVALDAYIQENNLCQANDIVMRLTLHL